MSAAIFDKHLLDPVPVQVERALRDHPVIIVAFGVQVYQMLIMFKGVLYSYT